MHRLCVKKRTLLLLAAIVWMFAGFQVLHIGVTAYGDYKGRILVFLSFGIFLVFWIGVFSRLVRKHTARICAYEEEMQPFYNFFDKKSFLIMAFMIVLGITIRKFQLWSLRNIAIFYTGLGAALFCAGGAFLAQYFLEKKRQKWKEEEEQEEERRKARYQKRKQEQKEGTE